MKDILNFEFSGLLLIFFIALGVILYFLLKVIKLKVVSNIFRKNFKYYYTFFEIVIWIIFGAWLLKVVFADSNYYIIILLTIFAILSVWIGWFVVKDFVAGVVLKLSDKYQEGQFFRMNDIKGYIAEVDSLHINVKQGNGENIKIPFSKILGSIHHKSFRDDKIKEHKFEITIDKRDTLEKIRKNIRNSILITTGADIKKEPIILLKNSPENSWHFEITCFVIDEKYNELIENNVKNSLK